MSLLAKSVDPVAGWTWMVEHDEAMSEFEAGASLVIKVSEALLGSDVFRPSAVKVEWTQADVGPLSVQSRLTGLPNTTSDSLAQSVRSVRPTAYEQAVPLIFQLSGWGTWFEGNGNARREPDLLGVTVYPQEELTMVELSVHHDIWAANDFRGVPHPRVYAHNSPRLAAVLTIMERELGVETEPDDPTYMGTPFNYGVRAPIGGTGRPLDVTDRL